MMFREPKAVITPALGMLREIGRVPKRQGRVATFDDGRKIENREMGHEPV